MDAQTEYSLSLLDFPIRSIPHSSVSRPISLVMMVTYPFLHRSLSGNSESILLTAHFKPLVRL